MTTRKCHCYDAMKRECLPVYDWRWEYDPRALRLLRPGEQPRFPKDVRVCIHCGKPFPVWVLAKGDGVDEPGSGAGS